MESFFQIRPFPVEIQGVKVGISAFLTVFANHLIFFTFVALIRHQSPAASCGKHRWIGNAPGIPKRSLIRTAGPVLVMLQWIKGSNDFLKNQGFFHLNSHISVTRSVRAFSLASPERAFLKLHFDIFLDPISG